jgi:hypothetical protein
MGMMSDDLDSVVAVDDDSVSSGGVILLANCFRNSRIVFLRLQSCKVEGSRPPQAEDNANLSVATLRAIESLSLSANECAMIATDF